MSEEAEQWEGIEDAAARRRIQNKLAQRRYRRNHRQPSLSRLITTPSSKQQYTSGRHHDPAHVQDCQHVEYSVVATPIRTSEQARRGPLSESFDGHGTTGIRTPPSSIPTFTDIHDFELSPIDPRLTRKDYIASQCKANYTALPELEREFFIDNIDFPEVPHLDDFHQPSNQIHVSKSMPRETLRSPINMSEARHSVSRHDDEQPRSCPKHGAMSTFRGPSAQQADFPVTRSTPLHCAVLGGHIETLELLIAGGSSLDSTDVFGRTALHVAVETDQNELVKLLLGSKADWTGRNAKGQTPLHTAAEAGHLTVMRSLLEVVTEVNSIDHTGRTALHIVAAAGNQEMVSLMIRKGANLNVGIQAVPLT